MSGKQEEFDITGMHCALVHVERVVSRLPGVADVKVNLLTRKGAVTYTADSTLTADDVVAAITGIGFGAELAEADTMEMKKVDIKPQLYRMILAAAMAIPMMVSMMGHYILVGLCFRRR